MSTSSNMVSHSESSATTEIHNQALEWLVVFWSGEVAAEERQEWQLWLKSSVEHQQAWQQVQRMEQKLKGMPATIASQALRAAPKSAKRRKLLQMMGVMLTMGVTAQVARETKLWQSFSADYRTATGEQRQIVLADGTNINLNTATAIDVRFDENERRVLLHEGEIMITTGSDRSPTYRPLIVETTQGTSQALGTRFNVRQMEDVSKIAVFEGAVAIKANQIANPYRIVAGQQTSFSETTVSPFSAVNIDDNAWLDGFLIAERMRLSEFLQELSRYRPGFIRCDPNASDLIVSGTYPLVDTDRILHSLSRVLPIRISYATRYWVTVSTA